MESIFSPFERGSRTEARVPGTGLGLAISQQIIGLMGGVIEVTSKPGEGSVFSFTIKLPVVETVEAEKILAGNSITGYKGQRRTVLVVDDKRENRLVLSAMLEPLGFDLILAADGAEAVELAAQFSPALILLDLVMPVMTGFEAILKIRSLPGLAAVPIVALSASKLDVKKEHDPQLGFNDFLLKPVVLDSLLETLQKHLNLEWIMEAEEVVSGIGRTAAETVMVEAPPQSDLEVLYELAQLGDIMGLRAYLQNLDKKSQQYQPFTDRVSKMAEMFDFRQIQTFLQQYIR
jgi:CheY-like chemotaxis protein